ncbi:hypothetical protein F4604DRAFT_618841 [Suillus subluteus]|nr:hypothetical protein F4604DRAFT_618841 [Suillus subluteus]
MASSSTKPIGATSESILKLVMTLQGYKPLKDEQYINGVVHHVSSISYSLDGQRMISGSWDGTARQWDLQMGKEIEKVRDVCEWEVTAVEVSKNGRWVVIAGGDNNYDDINYGELRACEVETGMVKTFAGHSRAQVTCIDISADSTLLASGSSDSTARIYNLDTGKLVAGPFKSNTFDLGVGAVRFSQDSKKLAVKSIIGKRLEIWDVHTQKLDARVGETIRGPGSPTYAPVFWTNKDQIIIAAFSHDDHVKYDHPKTIYEFDALTLKTVGAPFEGHTRLVSGLALSFDGALLASTSQFDNTIKLWAFESRQLLASFHIQGPHSIILSPNSHQLAYTTWCDTKSRIYICDTPPDILASILPAQEAQPNINTPRNPRRAVRRDPIKSPIRIPPKPFPTIDPQQPTFFRYLRKLLPSSSRTDAIRPIRNNERRGPLDFPATSPLPPNRFPSAQATTQSRSARLPPSSQSSTATPTTVKSRIRHLLVGLPIIDVPLAQGKERNAAAGAPAKDDDDDDDDDLIRDEDYVSPPPSPTPGSQPQSAARPINVTSGEHGSGRSCLCF